MDEINYCMDQNWLQNFAPCFLQPFELGHKVIQVIINRAQPIINHSSFSPKTVLAAVMYEHLKETQGDKAPSLLKIARTLTISQMSLSRCRKHLQKCSSITGVNTCKEVEV